MYSLAHFSKRRVEAHYTNHLSNYWTVLNTAINPTTHFQLDAYTFMLLNKILMCTYLLVHMMWSAATEDHMHFKVSCVPLSKYFALYFLNVYELHPCMDRVFLNLLKTIRRGGKYVNNAPKVYPGWALSSTPKTDRHDILSQRELQDIRAQSKVYIMYIHFFY